MLTVSIIFFFVVTFIDLFALCMVAVFIHTICSCYMLIYPYRNFVAKCLYYIANNSVPGCRNWEKHLRISLEEKRTESKQKFFGQANKAEEYEITPISHAVFLLSHSCYATWHTILDIPLQQWLSEGTQSC